MLIYWYNCFLYLWYFFFPILTYLVLGFAFTLFTLVYCYVNHFASELLLVLLLAELWSCVQWFIWALPWFLYKYPEDRRHFYDKLKRRSRKYGLPEDQV